MSVNDDNTFLSKIGTNISVHSFHKIAAVDDVTELCKDIDKFSGSLCCSLCTLGDKDDTFASTTDINFSVRRYV